MCWNGWRTTCSIETTRHQREAVERSPARRAYLWSPVNLRRWEAVRVSRSTMTKNEAAMPSGSVTRRPGINAGELVAIRILRLPEVCQVTGLKRAMIYRLQQRKSFPQSIKLTDHAVGWIDAEVRAWVTQRIGARRSSNGGP
jgi:prophage regulatory protein